MSLVESSFTAYFLGADEARGKRKRSKKHAAGGDESVPLDLTLHLLEFIMSGQEGLALDARERIFHQSLDALLDCFQHTTRELESRLSKPASTLQVRFTPSAGAAGARRTMIHGG
jgi:hypothetical protein